MSRRRKPNIWMVLLTGLLVTSVVLKLWSYVGVLVALYFGITYASKLAK